MDALNRSPHADIVSLFHDGCTQEKTSISSSSASAEDNRKDIARAESL